MATTTTRPTVAGVFPTRGQAEAAIDELLHAGFTQDQIGYVTPGGQVTAAVTPTARREEDAAEGAVAGTVVGGAVGARAGALVVAPIPGAGPLLAGGLLIGALGGAAAGAAVGSWVGPFVALELSDADARQYDADVRAGRTVVVVRAGDRRELAEHILRGHGAVRGCGGEVPSTQY